MKPTCTTKEKLNSRKCTFLVFLIHLVFCVYSLSSNLSVPPPWPQGRYLRVPNSKPRRGGGFLAVSTGPWQDPFPSGGLSCLMCKMQVAIRSLKVHFWLWYFTTPGCTCRSNLRLHLLSHRDTRVGPCVYGGVHSSNTRLTVFSQCLHVTSSPSQHLCTGGPYSKNCHTNYNLSSRDGIPMNGTKSQPYR